MSERSPLHDVVHDRFRQAFGPPQRVVGNDTQWSLPIIHIASINVLVNGSTQTPIVWVFDPHDPVAGVDSQTIRSEAEIAAIISAIEERVKLASRLRKA